MVTNNQTGESNMSIKEFQTDLQNGMTLELALQKHHTNLKTAFDKLHYKVNKNPPLNNKYRKKASKKRDKRYCPSQYIQCRNNHYYLRKCLSTKAKGRTKKTVQFGTYSSLEDAITVREAMKLDGWHITHLDQVCQELNIRRIR